jgi:lipopolysaccharide export system permease protein
LFKRFSAEAAMLFGVVAFLVFLIQTLRLFDSIAAKGQGFDTLAGQSLLGMPSILMAFFYVCLGIGLGRALRNLQAGSELQVIHSSRLVRPLMGAIFWFAIAGALLLLVIAHLIEPLSNRTSSQWNATIAADFVGHSLVPHKFTQLVDGVTVVIGGRDDHGTLTDFFADDTRNPDSRRSYIAKTGVISEDEAGYVLQLHDGVVQYLTSQKDFSEVSFTRYDLAIDRLTSQPGQQADTLAQTPSNELLATAFASGKWDDSTVRTLWRRTGEGLRVLAMCAFVAAVTAFPSGARRRFRVPVEIVVLAVAFIERGITSYAPVAGLLGSVIGALVLLAVGVVILALRLRVFSPVRLPRARRAAA